MTAFAISGMGLTGVLRLTWVQDNLAHVLDYSQADETFRDLDRTLGNCIRRARLPWSPDQRGTAIAACRLVHRLPGVHQ